MHKKGSDPIRGLCSVKLWVRPTGKKKLTERYHDLGIHGE